MNIGAIAQQQLLSVLFKALDGVIALQPGATVEARVARNLGDGRTILATAQGWLEADFRGSRTGAPAVGAHLMLRVDETQPQLRMTVLSTDRGAVPNLPALVKPTLAPDTSATAGAGAQAGPDAESSPEMPRFDATGARLAGTRSDTTIQAASVRLPPGIDDKAAARAELTRVVVQSAARQNGLAPLFADIAAALNHKEQPLPTPVLRLAAQMLKLRLDTDGPITGERLKQAVQRSGVFLEALLAAGEPPAGASDDLKSALIRLRDLALNVPGAEARAGRPLVPSPEPPRRDGLPVAQALEGTALTSDLNRAEAAALLGSEADAAVERMKLLQFASLPADAPTRSHEPPSTQWMLEVPLAYREQTGVAAFQFEREGDGRQTEDARSWKAKVSLDVETLGPVHAHVGLRAQTIGVTLWAENAETADHFRKLLPDWRRAMMKAELDVAEFRVLHGRPPMPITSHGYFLDRMT